MTDITEPIPDEGDVDTDPGAEVPAPDEPPEDDPTVEHQVVEE
jgi:hypothetical protein